MKTRNIKKDIRKEAREIAREIMTLRKNPNFYKEINNFIKTVS